MFALSLVHERGELFELERRHVLGEKGDDVLDAVLVRREHLERIADKEQIVLDDAMRVEDRATRIEAAGEDQRGAFIFQRAPAIGEQRAGAVMDRDREPAASDAFRREARREKRARLRRCAQRLRGLVRGLQAVARFEQIEGARARSVSTPQTSRQPQAPTADRCGTERPGVAAVATPPPIATIDF